MILPIGDKHLAVESRSGSRRLVSIITPTYNHERFIGACIESVLSQTYDDWEQIIIDDGSTDKTEAIAAHYHDPRIRYYRQENRGIKQLAETYNRALSEASGSLIAILEGDDLWPNSKLSRIVPLFDDKETVLAHGEAQDVDVRGVISKRNPRIYRERMKLPRSILFNDPVGSSTGYLLTLSGQSFITTATVLVRRRALESIGGFQYIPEHCSPDIPTFVRLSTVGKFRYTPEVLGFRRRHLGSATLQNLSSMPQSAHMYALQASRDPALGLSAKEQERVSKSWEKVVQKSSFTQGRIALINQEWATARMKFLSAIKCFEGRIMACAMAGWVLSWFHRDLEALFKFTGRTPLKPVKT